MSTIVAYAKLLRAPGIGAFGVAPVIGTVAMGATDLYSLTLTPRCFLNLHPNHLVYRLYSIPWREIIQTKKVKKTKEDLHDMEDV